ncbi:uncharacterized protein LOC143291166 [Babylonia areolata]|uniref:uncharacterized protein LOC143291166 n=1 Tax=Babylonia areolata TaxID=304850 RepID=UPI003FD121D1
MSQRRDGRRGSKTTFPKDHPPPHDDMDGEEGVRKTREEDGEGDGMGAIQQSTLLTYHLAIEDSVDPDRVWPDLQHLFTHHEQEDIQAKGTKKGHIKKMLDLLVNKNDDAFDALVNALQPDYEWLAVRLQQGVKDEEQRIKKVGKGMKRKMALAMLTVRISERQRDVILDRMTSVVEKEMTQKANRVNVPDHRAAAQLDQEHKMLQDIICHEIDPLLYGEVHTSPRTREDHDDILGSLRSKLEELKSIKQCYAAFDLDTNASPRLPSLLLEKIDEVKSKIKTLKKEKKAAAEEAQRLSRTAEEQQRSLFRLEQHRRNLELEKNTLESDRQWLDQTVRKSQEDRRELEKQYQKVTEENRDLLSEIQQARDRLASLSHRNRTLDNRNSKLTRDNQKLSAANTSLRKEVRNSGTNVIMAVKSENLRLSSDRVLMKKDLQKMETEKRRLAIRSQKLESENRVLRDQKVRLNEDKRRSLAENRALRTEGKRLALGKFSPLPLIGESRERPGSDGASRTSRSRSVTPQSRQTVAWRTQSGESPTHRKDGQPGTPWNKYEENGTGNQQRDKEDSTGNQQRDKEDSTGNQQRDKEDSTGNQQRDKEGSTGNQQRDKEGSTGNQQRDKEGSTGNQQRDKEGSTGNQQRDKEGSNQQKEKADDGKDKGAEEKRKAGDTKPTTSSDSDKQGKEEGRSSASPRRAAARK